MSLPQHLSQVALQALRPTQITVGAAEVAAKRTLWAGFKRKERARMLSSHWFPAVLGPKQQHFIVDHHHLGMALWDENVPTVWVMQLADFSDVPEPLFWRLLEFHQWVHPYDAKGRRQNFSAIPKQLNQLRDDPYRSLAGEVRKAGGFAKDTTPFAEFIWADFFRPHIPRKRLAANAQGLLDATVVTEALALAHSPAAHFLPGWSGSQIVGATS